MTIRLSVVDDHRLFREGIVSMIKDWGADYDIILEANNGVELLDKLGKSDENPHIIIMDSEMPVMNGAEATAKVKDRYPEILILALTMLDGRPNFMRMVRAGIDGFLDKNTSPAEVKSAIDRLMDSGHYFKGDRLKSVLQFLSGEDRGLEILHELTEKEIRFVELSSSELKYEAIAKEMSLSDEALEEYRDSIFQKLGVKTRVGMVLRALQEGIIRL